MPISNLSGPRNGLFRLLNRKQGQCLFKLAKTPTRVPPFDPSTCQVSDWITLSATVEEPYSINHSASSYTVSSSREIGLWHCLIDL